jgi:hypothetical protein
MIKIKNKMDKVMLQKLRKLSKLRLLFTTKKLLSYCKEEVKILKMKNGKKLEK